MDDLYAINVAKTEFREGYNLATRRGSWRLRIQTWLTSRASSPVDLAKADWMSSQFAWRSFSSNLQ